MSRWQTVVALETARIYSALFSGWIVREERLKFKVPYSTEFFFPGIFYP
jgi:hypothetical protein